MGELLAAGEAVFSELKTLASGTDQRWQGHVLPFVAKPDVHSQMENPTTGMRAKLAQSIAKGTPSRNVSALSSV